MRPIVLVHGFWVTPRSWENWIAHYQAKGHQVIAPPYPGFDVEVEALRADPTPIANLTVPAVIARYEEAIRQRPEPPVIIGHSAGGAFTHNDDRAPLLFVSGSEDNIMPPAVQESNCKHYKSSTVTEWREYAGYSHLLPAQKGWEQIADEVLDWALAHAR